MGLDISSDIVWFKGTRIIGTSPDNGTDIPILDDPQDGHGTAVTGAVLDANPEAVIFFVEGFSDAAVLVTANQPLVDIITTSFGPIGSVPVPGIEDATKVAVVQNKKIHAGVGLRITPLSRSSGLDCWTAMEHWRFWIRRGRRRSKRNNEWIIPRYCARLDSNSP